jgi:CheY-like chemotaxis protein
MGPRRKRRWHSMPKRILLVDDDDDIREVAQMVLEVAGEWKVSAASSGADALKQAAAEPPDAVLLDVMMPGMDGFETLKRLKSDERTATVPVILLTAKSRAMQAGLAARAAGVIMKPFDPMQLAAKVAGILEREAEIAPSGAGGRIPAGK